MSDHLSTLRKLAALSASSSDGRGDIAARVVPVYLTARDHAALAWAVAELSSEQKECEGMSDRETSEFDKEVARQFARQINENIEEWQAEAEQEAQKFQYDRVADFVLVARLQGVIEDALHYSRLEWETRMRGLLAVSTDLNKRMIDNLLRSARNG